VKSHSDRALHYACDAQVATSTVIWLSALKR